MKTIAARSVNARRGTVGARVWQRNYFERVVRTGEELERIRWYIQSNPQRDHRHSSDDDLAEAWLDPIADS